MPMYEYQCTTCGYKFEHLQKFSDPLLKLCPSCKKESLEKLISQSGFMLKGSGWHKNDYKPAHKSTSSSCPKAKECSKKQSGECAA